MNRRNLLCLLFGLTATFFHKMSLVFGQSTAAPPPVTQPVPAPVTVGRPTGTTITTTAKRLREGTLFQQKLATFQMTGNRVTMFVRNPDTPENRTGISTNTGGGAGFVTRAEQVERYVCLENLNLERILLAIRNTHEERTWSVDGVITEFQGNNYILIQRAVFVATPQKT